MLFIVKKNLFFSLTFSVGSAQSVVAVQMALRYLKEKKKNIGRSWLFCCYNIAKQDALKKAYDEEILEAHESRRVLKE